MLKFCFEFTAKNMKIYTFLAHSKNELIQWRGVRRLSVSLSVCPSVCKLLRKMLLLPGKWPDCHQTRWTSNFHKMDSRSACIQGVLKVKVKVKGHVIRALLCWHENRLFSQGNGSIATKLAHDGQQVSLHPGCAQGQGQGQKSRDTRTFLDSWNELLRH